MESKETGKIKRELSKLREVFCVDWGSDYMDGNYCQNLPNYAQDLCILFYVSIYNVINENNYEILLKYTKKTWKIGNIYHTLGYRNSMYKDVSSP